MEKYDYLKAVTEDVEEYINQAVDLEDYSSKDELYQYLYDVLFCEDSVTGNASGSYTFSYWEAEENLCHNLDLLKEALEEFGEEDYSILDSPESCDVTIRCYLLGQAISTVLDVIWEEEDDEEDEDE